MYYVSEQTSIDLIGQKEITDAVEMAFLALARDEAECWPIVRETLNYANAIFGFKSGFDRASPAMGVKAGGLWPGNAAKGIANHQSTVVLFDIDSGAPSALVRGTYLTALRTAAASALSIRHLARRDAKTLGIIGAGGQGIHQVSAALMERDFADVIISDPDRSNCEALGATLEKRGTRTRVADPETLTRNADVIITVTPSRQPIVQKEWVQPGTHIAAMGADTKGKQELQHTIISENSLFGDVADQAFSLGESQHAAAAGEITEKDFTTLGSVINGSHAGRADDDCITVFDSTGMALQDLAACTVALEKAIQAGRAVELD